MGFTTNYLSLKWGIFYSFYNLCGFPLNICVDKFIKISNQKFITDILNINYDQIESIDSIKNSDHSINFFVKLKPVSNLYCDPCHIVGNGFTKRKLIHSTLVN